MSTLGSVMSNALRSMTANQVAMAVASNNIANANNLDYSRQRLITHPAGPDGGPWGIGMGVNIFGVEALRDKLLEVRWRQGLSAKSDSETLAGRLSDIEAQFNDSNGTGLLEKITGFFNSFQTLSQDPASLTFREQVRISAGALVEAIHARDRDLTNMKTATDNAITTDVEHVNGLLTQIADLTGQIKAEEVGLTANDLRDRRGALVKELSQYVEVNELDSGDYQITTQDNQLLVFNNIAKPLTPADVTQQIGPGILRSEVAVRDTYVPKYSAALDQLAYEIAQQVNTIHSKAFDLDGNTNINFFDPLTAVAGAAQALSLSADVAADPRKIAASKLAVGNDNGAALELANLLYNPVFSGGSVTEQYGALVFAVGSDVAAAQDDLHEQEAMVTQLENRRQSISGVSMDEEAMQITQFQRSYEASARLIKTVDELLQVTLSMVS